MADEEAEINKLPKMRNVKISKVLLYSSSYNFEDLGIYNSNTEKDKKINDELKSFLKSIGCKPARLIIGSKK